MRGFWGKTGVWLLMFSSAVFVGAEEPTSPAPTEEEANRPEENASGLLGRVQRFLDEDAWRYERVGESALLRMGFEGTHGSWTVIAQVKEDYEQVCFYSVWPNKTPESKRAATAEYLMRANFGMPLVCFEMDYETGEVRCRTGIDVEGGELAPTMIKNLLYMNVLTFDRYLPGLNKVVYGDVSPAAAIQEVEQGTSEQSPAAQDETSRVRSPHPPLRRARG